MAGLCDGSLASSCYLENHEQREADVPAKTLKAEHASQEIGKVIIVLSFILSDMDSDLLKQGQPTNTWSNASPTYDLEYADDTLLLALTTDQLHAFRTRLEDIAAEYGMTLNHQKTELLPHPKLPHSSLRFKDGSPVQSTPQVKYLGSLISWEKPFEQAFYHRLDLAEETLKNHAWYRIAPNLANLRYIYFKPHLFVPTLTYASTP